MLRYNGTTGQFDSIFIPSGSAGLGSPNFFVLTADVPEPAVGAVACLLGLVLTRRRLRRC